MVAPSSLRTLTVSAGSTWAAAAGSRVGRMCSQWEFNLCLLRLSLSGRMKKQVLGIDSCPTAMHHMINRF